MTCLFISIKFLNYISPTSLYSFTGLRKLILTTNQLTNAPDLSRNTALLILDLSRNQLTTLPALPGGALRNLILFRLNDNPLLPAGDAPHTWGRRELRERFGYRISMDDPIAAPLMKDCTTEAAVYDRLQVAGPHINFPAFEGLLPPQVPGRTFGQSEVLHALDVMWHRLNLTESRANNYVGYESAANDFGEGPQLPGEVVTALMKQEALSHDGALNKLLMVQYVKPRLAGFFMTLWGLPLGDGETSGWQINEGQRDELKHALSYILSRFGAGNEALPLGKVPASAAVETGDHGDAAPSAVAAVDAPLYMADDVVPPLFYMLTNALFHCPTGQVEGVNAMIYSLLSTGSEQGDFIMRISRMLALKKIDWFAKAVLTKGATSSQNVHLVSYYRQVLAQRMNLPSAVRSYQERMGVLGRDPFNGNRWNVLQVFYQLVTPDRMAGWLLEHTENQVTLDLRGHQEDLEVALGLLSQQAPVALTETQLRRFQAAGLTPLQQTQMTLREDIDARLRERGVTPTDKGSLETALKAARSARSAMDQDRMHRFFTIGDIMRFFHERGLIPTEGDDMEGQPVAQPHADPAPEDVEAPAPEAAIMPSPVVVSAPWWQGRFTESPLESKNALLTHQGAMDVLRHLCMLVLP